jgi:hypothetical protein
MPMLGAVPFAVRVPKDFGLPECARQPAYALLHRASSRVGRRVSVCQAVDSFRQREGGEPWSDVVVRRAFFEEGSSVHGESIPWHKDGKERLVRHRIGARLERGKSRLWTEFRQSPAGPDTVG